MDHAVSVSETRRLEDLADDRHRLARGKPPVDQLLQRLALEELHRDVVGAVELAPIEDPDDVRVLKGGGGLRLAAEALDELTVLGEPVVEHLQRHTALKVAVLDAPDVRHAAGSDPVERPVAPVDDRSLVDLSHLGPPALPP